MPELNKVLSVPELRLCVGILDKEIHPSVVFFCLHQCRMQRKINGRWPDVRCSELDMLQIYYIAQRRQAKIEALRDLQNILAKNQKTPLIFDDAAELFRVLKSIKAHNLNWKNFPISKTGFKTLIQMATDGYSHSVQVA